SDLVLAQLEYGIGGAPPVAGDDCVGIPLRQVGRPPLPGRLAGRTLQKYWSPGRYGKRRALAVRQALIPRVSEGGIIRGGAAGHQITPELDHALGLLTGQVDLDGLLAVEAKGPGAGLPQVGDQLAGLVRGDVDEVALWVLRVIGLSRGSEIVVGLRCLEARL